MAYIRWRPRMVYQSVLNDIKSVLEDLEWYDPNNPTAIPAAYRGVMKKPLKIIDYYPEQGLTQGNVTVPNALAIDDGTPGQILEAELGGEYEQQYLFQMTLLAESDAFAKMILSDLWDRYSGRSQPDYITLYNYAENPAEEVTRMEVDSFLYAPDNEAPTEYRFYVAELQITDRLDAT